MFRMSVFIFIELVLAFMLWWQNDYCTPTMRYQLYTLTHRNTENCSEKTEYYQHIDNLYNVPRRDLAVTITSEKIQE